jgi:hypothetical protein
MEKKRISIVTQPAAGSSHAAIVSSAAEPRADEVSAQLERYSISSQPAARTSVGPPPAHSRTSSRAGHGRGHSRNGSISLAGPSSVGAAAAAPAPAARPTSTMAFVASASHSRRHSRSGSRSASRSGIRPASLLFGAPAAAPHRRDSVSDAQQTASLAEPTAVGFPPRVPSPLSAEVLNTPQTSCSADSSTPAQTPVAVQPTPSSHARKPSRHSRRTSVSTRRESMEIMGGIGLGIGAAASADSALSNATTKRSSRRFSTNRHSGILSASVLFGGSPDPVPGMLGSRASVRRSGARNDFDWRVFATGAEEPAPSDGSDRLTALEKLEGRSRPAAASTQASSGPSNAAGSNRRHSRQSSVQLPSFDDVHGSEAMDRRASVSLLEANETTTSSERPPPLAPRLSLAPPAAVLSLSGDVVEALSVSAAAGPNSRPTSIRIAPDAASQLEGLGTLLEEEEEEEDTSLLSPVRERPSLDLDQAIERRQRKEAEAETIKQNRRGSLTPKPLKLKSRPASLFVGSNMGLAAAASTLLSPRGMTSSNSLPQLAALADVGEEGEAAAEDTPAQTEAPISSLRRSSDSETAAPASAKPREVSLVDARQKLAEARANVVHAQQHGAVATPEMKRSWRSSLPAASAVPNPQSSTPPSDTPVRVRQGMRALRLGSGSVSSGPHHQGASDSLSSISSVATSLSAGPNAASKRQSMSMSVSTSRDDLQSASAHASPTSRDGPSPIGLRNRSSIHYKPSSSTPLSAPAAVGDANASSSPLATHQATFGMPSSSSSAVSHGMYEEVKSAHARTTALLEASRKQADRLGRELAVESERAAREYAELERWSAEEKRTLGMRIEHLESGALAAQQTLQAREADWHAQLAEVQRQVNEASERLEDAEAERDMLQEDVDGWRTRCSDLEKSLRTERAALDEERRFRTTAKLRIGVLTHKLEEAGLTVPASASEELTFEDSLPHDLVSALRSPALGSSSPVLGPGYFSPAIGGSGFPVSDAAPPPQAVKLLKEMRQQIFNLAGSLEHERKEHLKAQQEASSLRAALQEQDEQRAAAAASPADPPSPNECGDDSHASSMGSVTSGSSSERHSLSGFVAPSSRNKRHVFAYDSSMGSTSMGSGSIATGASSVVPSEYEHGSRSLDSADKFAFLSELEAAAGGLQPLAETEEEQDDLEALSDHAKTPSARASSYMDDEPVDLESGCFGDEEEYDDDIEAANRASNVESSVPPTPGLDHSSQVKSTFGTIPVLAVEGKVLPHSAQSSLDSRGPTSPGTSTSPESDEVHTPAMLAADDWMDELDEDDEEAAGDATRPEFVREWSFSLASAAMEAKKQRVLEARRAAASAASFAAAPGSQMRKRMPRRRKLSSTEDFFGLMSLDVKEPLPALPVPDAALEMPPVYVDSSSQYSPQASIDYRRTSVESYDRSPRVSMRVSSGASLAHGARPPVARSAFAHQQDVYGGATGILSVEDGGIAAMSSPIGGLMGGALARMSLGGLTSALGGLSGYLLSSQSNVAQAAALATKTCAAAPELETPTGSISWSAQRREERDEEESLGSYHSYASRSQPRTAAW